MIGRIVGLAEKAVQILAIPVSGEIPVESHDAEKIKVLTHGKKIQIGDGSQEFFFLESQPWGIPSLLVSTKIAPKFGEAKKVQRALGVQRKNDKGKKVVILKGYKNLTVELDSSLGEKEDTPLLVTPSIRY